MQVVISDGKIANDMILNTNDKTVTPQGEDLGTLVEALKVMFPSGEWKEYKVVEAYSGILPNIVGDRFTPPFTIDVGCKHTGGDVPNLYTITSGESSPTQESMDLDRRRWREYHKAPLGLNDWCKE